MLSFLRDKIEQRTERFSHQNFALAGNLKIFQFADAPVAEPFVKILRAVVEGRDAQKNIFSAPENFCFGELHDFFPKSAILKFGKHGDELNITIERTAEMQNEHAGDFLSKFGGENLALRMREVFEKFLRRNAERAPRAEFHKSRGAGARLGVVAQRADDQVVHGLSMAEKFCVTTLNFECGGLNLYSAHGQRKSR
jgi:hypothetical protein